MSRLRIFQVLIGLATVVIHHHTQPSLSRPPAHQSSRTGRAPPRSPIGDSYAHRRRFPLTGCTKNWTERKRSNLHDFPQRQKSTPATLTLEEILSGAGAGDEYDSWYEHEIFRKIAALYEAAPDKCTFVKETVPALPGYDARATEAIYGSRGINEALVFRLPEVPHLTTPACTVYRHPDAPKGPGHQRAWSIVRFYYYEIQPNFYEQLDPIDLEYSGILAAYPKLGDWSPKDDYVTKDDYISWPHTNMFDGSLTFSPRTFSFEEIEDYARKLRDSMENIGVITDPVIDIVGRDYNPLALPNTNRPEDGKHPYESNYPNRSSEDPYARPPMYQKPRYHKVIPEAGPSVPDQGSAEALLMRLYSWRYWKDREEKKQRLLTDPAIN